MVPVDLLLEHLCPVEEVEDWHMFLAPVVVVLLLGVAILFARGICYQDGEQLQDIGNQS